MLARALAGLAAPSGSGWAWALAAARRPNKVTGTIVSHMDGTRTEPPPLECGDPCGPPFARVGRGMEESDRVATGRPRQKGPRRRASQRIAVPSWISTWERPSSRRRGQPRGVLSVVSLRPTCKGFCFSSVASRRRDSDVARSSCASGSFRHASLSRIYPYSRLLSATALARTVVSRGRLGFEMLFARVHVQGRINFTAAYLISLSMLHNF